MPASNYLVGTAPDQVPSNADLGEMAFQSKDAVEFTGGKGGLSHLDITAISAQLNVSATDVFVYDTSKDSDGGAWRNRCQHTSWFNEELNTATRGARREFPSVAVIVATTSSITIYDGDFPDLPMWMVFVGGSAGLAGTLMLQNGNRFSVAAMNGILVTGVHTNGDNWGSPIINFISEKVVRMDPHITEGGSWLGGGIADRNLQKGYASYAVSGAGYLIVDSRISDVAITVLPNAPIDAATRLPTPTIAVGTNSGISVIRHDGAVVNQTLDTSSWSLVAFVEISPQYLTWGTSSSEAWSIVVWRVPVPTTSAQWYEWEQDSFAYVRPLAMRYSQNGAVPMVASWDLFTDYAASNLGTYYTGLFKLDIDENDHRRSMSAVVTTKANTGWMPGNIKGAWLSDTTQETLVGGEYVSYGDFASGSLAGWTTSGDTTPTFSNGGALLTTGVTDGEIFQYVSATKQQWWTISWTITSNTAGYFGLYLNQAATQVGGALVKDVITQSGSFQYFGSITSIAFRHRSSGSGVIDNISLKPGDPDRAVTAGGLQVYGAITKTPVAAGADLVAYSGFSASNYLEQPYNPALDFGTGDFSISGWVNPAYSAGNHQQYYICNRGTNPASGSRWEVRIPGNVEWFRFYINDGSTTAYIDSTATAPANAWTHFCAIRKSGRLYLYVNGADSSTGGLNVVGSYNLTNTSAKFWVGQEYNGLSTSAFISGGISLLRVSATAPSAEQVAKMYNDEKHLFQNNAKATLYGTSDSVTALAYDEDTQLLHVGTSSGRSVFDGLRRVDNTTTAVSATISAANGLVVEN